MSNADIKLTISLWVGPEREEALKKANMLEIPELQEAFAGLKRLRVPITYEQAQKLKEVYPSAKIDTSSTQTVELLPRECLDKIFAMVIEKKNVNVIPDLLKSLGK
ncbi:MAG: hypothetical protein C0177_06740 [Fervidicoccus fontis]|uniref:Uncharacterized protein n=1 Tax=Thermodesulfobium acidiphilum TaxID=1794699 RepID=A0A2R4W2H8_THEAF|nr:hypothetical protein [Thermodesulfobium acidiphilum]AWB10908.1 hypothetical protein TDSAC_1572 [Thermodesulfobium acidiphilum]PMB76328.1 MAG: hypothetical protein C0177_06740 [Fervidicoccus fontis]